MCARMSDAVFARFLQYDVRNIESNARAFNKPNSAIVKYVRLVTELTLRLIR